MNKTTRLSSEDTAFLSVHAQGIDSKTFLFLKKCLGSYERVALLSRRKLLDYGLTPDQAEAIIRQKSELDRCIATIEQLNISLIYAHTPEFPALLNEIPDPPAVLYARGQLPVQSSVSVVGTRKPSSYGQKVTHDVARQVSQLGLVVVSGLAFGVDGIAHQTTLLEKGITVAVLGGGIEQISPLRHTSLGQQIIDSGGALISEYPLFTPSFPGNFLERNRIIAAISSVTIITECGLRSGALRTARAALAYERDLWVVPGSIYNPLCRGTNNLLRQAPVQPYLSIDQLRDKYSLTQQKPAESIDLTEDERLIVNNLTPEGIHLNKLSEVLQLDIEILSSKVIMLELKGMIRHEGAGVYRRVI